MSNNPASKLAEVLRRGQQVNGSHPTWKAWADIFKVDAKRVADIYPQLLKLSRAASEVQLAVEKNCQQRKFLLLKYMPELRDIISPSHLETGWEVYRSRITPELLYGLDFCASELTPHYPSEEFLSDLPKIKQNLTSVSEQIAEGNLPVELKNLILARIEDLFVAIDDYEALRISGVEHAVQATVGAIALNNKAILQEDHESKSWLEKLREVIEGLNRYIRVAYAGVQLGDTITKLIGKP